MNLHWVHGASFALIMVALAAVGIAIGAAVDRRSRRQWEEVEPEPEPEMRPSTFRVITPGQDEPFDWARDWGGDFLDPA